MSAATINTVAGQTAADLLRRAPIFAHLSPGDLTFLSHYATRFRAEAGEAVLSVDEPPTSFTFLLDGQWTMQRFVAGRPEPVIWTDDRPGSWHGGVNAIDAIAPANVVADRPSEFLSVPVPAMLELVRRAPAVASHLLRGIHGGAALLWTELNAAATVAKANSHA